MSEFTQFVATTPYVKPATEEVVYDKYWMSEMNVRANDPTKPIQLRAKFVPARDMSYEANVNGEITTVSYKELMPNAPSVELKINDVFAAAAEDPELALTMDSVFKILKKIATAQNLL
jgi:hypothetical protein